MANPDEIRQIVRQSLAGWRLAGVTTLTGHGKPVTSSSLQESGVAKSNAVSNSESIPQSGPQEEISLMARAGKKQVSDSQMSPEPAIENPPITKERSKLSLEQRTLKLQQLAGCVADCVRCSELARTRTQTVFGVGNPQARLLFMGEAPGADEDKQGEPFVGRAGQLLNKIIEAMKMKREDLYICNILRCRPPGNRAPAPEEAANCREWLNGQLATVDPDFIVCWGTVAAQNLLGSMEAISKMRGRFYSHGRAKVLCTYHPSYLLRNPSAKKPVWEDMQLLLKEMGLPVPK